MLMYGQGLGCPKTSTPCDRSLLEPWILRYLKQQVMPSKANHTSFWPLFGYVCCFKRDAGYVEGFHLGPYLSGTVVVCEHGANCGFFYPFVNFPFMVWKYGHTNPSVGNSKKTCFRRYLDG